MEYESEGDTHCNWYSWYSHKRIGTGSEGFRNERTTGDYPKYIIVEISQNTEKSPGELRKRAVT